MRLCSLRKVRSRVEKIFGIWTRSYRLRRMRWLRLAKSRLQMRLAAIAYNVKRCWRLQTA
jgi:transposase, IS5 family